ncbi:MAG: glycosyltransferase family 4 protein [Myxococcota bacterium]
MSPRSGTRPRRRILIAPFSRNPYITSLCEGLRARGFIATVLDLPNLFVPRGFTSRVDVLHVHWLDRFFAAGRRRQAYARAMSFLAQVRYAIRVQGLHVVWTCHTLESHGHPYPHLDDQLRRRFARIASAIVVHSSFAKARLVERFDVEPRRVTVLPHPNYDEAYSVGTRFVPPPGEGPVLLSLGCDKGIERIIDASVNCRVPHRLWIVGEVEQGFDDAKVVIAASAHRHITYRPGALDLDEVAGIFAASDVVVPPACDILTSDSLVLAMSMAKPCVVPGNSYAKGVLPEAGGVFYRVEDASALRRAFEDVLNRTADYESMGELNRATALQWDWPSFVRATAELYRA